MAERIQLRGDRLACGGLALLALSALWGCASSGPGTRHRDLQDRYEREESRVRSAEALPADSLFAEADVLAHDPLVAAVLARNPGLDAAREAWRAALTAYRTESGLDDPQLSYSLAPGSIGSELPYGQEIELRQMFPFPGKLRLAGEAANADAEMAFEDYEALRLDLAAAASKLYYEFYRVERSLAINAEHRRLVGEYLRIAVSRYRAGSASQEEPLRAEVEAARLERRELELARRRTVLVAELNALLHRDPRASLPAPPALLPPPGSAVPDQAALRDSALARRPELRALDAEARGLRASVDLAGKESYPDFALMGSYSSMWMETEHRWMVGVMVNLPLGLDRRSAGRERSQARLARVESLRRLREDDVRRDLEVAAAGLDESARVVDLYRDRLLPASRDQVAAARAGFEAGRTLFLDLIDARRGLQDLELEYEEALADYYRSRTDLLRAGGRLPLAEGVEP